MKPSDYSKKIFGVAIATIILSGMLFGCGAAPRGARFSELTAQDTVLPVEGKLCAAVADIGDSKKHIAAIFRIRELLTKAKIWIPSIELTVQDTAVEVQETTLTYGHLQIELPEGVTVEEVASGGDSKVIDLINAQKVMDSGEYRGRGPLPPRLWLTHYHTEYDGWSEKVFINVLLEQHSEYDFLQLRDSQYLDGYSFWASYTKPYQNGYIYWYMRVIFILWRK
ncbi:MAG: hypothetical protein NC337_05255 [Roseburia sp.]|nr:hypothetical protein [Roseburia sp.]